MLAEMCLKCIILVTNFQNPPSVGGLCFGHRTLVTRFGVIRRVNERFGFGKNRPTITNTFDYDYAVITMSSAATLGGNVSLFFKEGRRLDKSVRKKRPSLKLSPFFS